MNCLRARRLLMDRLAGGLARKDDDALDHHLAGCETCRAEAEALREAWRALGALKVSSPPPSVKSNLLRAIEAERKRKERILPTLGRLLPAPLGAGFASLGLALLFSYEAFAGLCMSWLGRALGTAGWPMEPFFFLAGLIYSSLPLGLAFGLLTGRVDPSPARSAALAGTAFIVAVSPYVLVVCMALTLGSAVSLASGFVAGTWIPSWIRARVWKTRLVEIFA